jgi:hypothetical protein
MYDDDEIRDVRQMEQRDAGGKSKAEKIDKKLLGDVRRAFRSGNQREFMQALRKIGISDDSPKFAGLVKLFRESHGPSSE